MFYLRGVKYALHLFLAVQFDSIYCYSTFKTDKANHMRGIDKKKITST